MKRKILKTLTVWLAVVFAGSILASCSKWDEFKEYTKNGEITYSGKLDSVKIYPGDGRIKIRALLPADPKIVKARIFWNNMTDSVEFPINMSNGRILEHVLPMAEGLKSFTLYTYDARGNRSVPVYAVGTALGSRYQSSISNRVVTSAVNVNTTTTINWVSADLSASPIFTEVKYLSATGQKIAKVPANQDVTVINDLAPTAKTFTYRTAYLPANSIDTFYTAEKTVGIFKDVTTEYLKNTRLPATVVVKGDRWGTPTDWVTNAAARNFRNWNGEYYGGVDYWFGGPRLAMEAGWSGDNMATITNGKMYQSPTLPAGTYTFEMDIPDCTRGAEFYTVAAAGDEIPNIENITSSLAHAKTSAPGTHKITFTLTTATKVSLGFVGHLTSYGGGGGTFWRIDAVRLKQLPLVN